MGCRGKAPGDCTSPVMGCSGEEPKVGKGKDQSGLGRNKHGKTEGYGDKRDRPPVNRSVCVFSCALPQITAVCPVCSLISFCNSFPGALFSMHVRLRDKWSQTTGHRGPWVCGASKGEVSFCRSGCDHREYQAGLASKLAVWPGNQGQGRMSKRGN